MAPPRAPRALFRAVSRALTRAHWVHALSREIIIWYIRFVRLTSIWRIEGTADRDRLHDIGQPFLIILWHNRIAMMPYAWEEETRNLTVMASSHRDGQLVIDGLGRFGFSAIPIDSRQGGSGPTRQVLRVLKEGRCVGITPDGPRGPRMRMRPAMAQLAAMAQVPIVPVTYGVSRRKLLSSWDRFLLPIPFSRAICLWGEAIDPPARGDPADLERCTREMEAALNDLSATCDRRCGVDPIEPAPEGSAPRPGSRERTREGNA
ncbi:lysophospholipid acyltransferase family protein [Marivibrio halodurans]|uniref:Lysophospholipid acyltransferase family protein n=1 Tax=Marivibrio halodurans TaxID=2039722 RepID=A0A8J7S5J3_9PROT|nr:lysophospholipid acyltransferase family protein [Marivibrio halodurans]MBP5858898.1 lysophospholipid acyltransferase family protein [Marivibrio halodurans]